MYICTNIDTKKLSPTFLWVSKFDVKLGVGEHHFRNYLIYVSFEIFGSKLAFFLSVFNWIHKNVICHLKLSLKVRFRNTLT